MTTPTPQPERISAAEIREEFEKIHKELDILGEMIFNLSQAVTTITQGLQHAATASQPAPAVGPSETMLAETLIYSIDDNGKPAYKLRGGRYSKNGVRVWPEVLKTLFEDLTKLQPGPTAINPPVLVAVELATRPGRADLGEDPAQQVQYARKVIGRA